MRDPPGKTMRRAVLAGAAVCCAVFCSILNAQTAPIPSPKPTETIAVSQIHAGMRGVAYTVFDQAIRNPSALAKYWPPALTSRINNGTASAIHIPFKQAPIYDAIEQFSHEKMPLGGGLGFYSDAAYSMWGLA